MNTDKNNWKHKFLWSVGAADDDVAGEKNPGVRILRLILIVLGIAVLLSGCGTLDQGDFRRMSDSELQLRRYQLAVRTNRSTWGSGYEDWKDDMEQKEEIEAELMRRGLINPAKLPQRIAPVPNITWGDPQPPIL